MKFRLPLPAGRSMSTEGMACPRRPLDDRRVASVRSARRVIIARVERGQTDCDSHWPYKLAEADPRHGTVNGYRNLGCRCPACRQASTRNHRLYIAKVRSEGRVLSEHGTETAYSSGCRCDVCREAHNKRSREYKRRRTQAAYRIPAVDEDRGAS